MPPFQEFGELAGPIQSLVEELQAEFGFLLESVILTGSIAKGRRRPSSDLDLLVLTSGPFEESRFRIKDGIETDIKICSVYNLGHEARSSDYLANSVRHGRALYDGNGCFARLRSLLNTDAFFSARQKSALQHTAGARHEPLALMADVKSAFLEELPERSLVLANTFVYLLGMHIIMAGHNAPKSSRVVEEFGLMYPQWQNYVDNYIACQNDDERLLVFESFAIMSSEHYGGRITEHNSERRFVL